MEREIDLKFALSPFRVVVGLAFFLVFIYLILEPYLHSFLYTSLSALGITFVVFLLYLFNRKEYVLNNEGIIIKSSRAEKKISWDGVLAMSRVRERYGFHYEIRTKEEVIKIPRFFSTKALEERIVKEAKLEFLGDLEENKKVFQYASPVYHWKKKGVGYQYTSFADWSDSKDLFGQHQKLGWLLVIIGASLFLAVYLRFLLYGGLSF